MPILHRQFGPYKIELLPGRSRLLSLADHHGKGYINDELSASLIKIQQSKFRASDFSLIIRINLSQTVMDLSIGLGRESCSMMLVR